ncbi:MAG: hypothetical protein M3P11_12035 [Actinomycetota bacterium]|jgi:hypothetical protein|nr:hypothetical protein [Actinomycetota bacterium]
MTPEVQTRSGRCQTHGTVQATRDIPKLQFPFIVYAVTRWLAKRRPFLCPQCGEPVETS